MTPAPNPKAILWFFYQVLLGLAMLLMLPMWFAKVLRRGGLTRQLWQRLGIYQEPLEFEPSGVNYLHAVSVGEVLMALKLLNAWATRDPAAQFVLAVSTTTGHAIAQERANSATRIIYAPVDLDFALSACWKRFTPQRLILIDGEYWPNLLRWAQQNSTPAILVNARMSERSERKFLKFQSWSRPLFQLFSQVGVQGEADLRRFQRLGVSPQALTVTGSVKFDPESEQPAQRREEFTSVLDQLGRGPVLLLASTFPGEEKALAQALRSAVPDARLVIVPRHAERRHEVVADLQAAGIPSVLRSSGQLPAQGKGLTYISDTTGELKSWTALADLVLIGKSLLHRGGQNPAEAILAGVPVITGPFMENFQPLTQQLVQQEGLRQGGSAVEMAKLARELLDQPELASRQTQRARRVLELHRGATQRSLEMILGTQKATTSTN